MSQSPALGLPALRGLRGVIRSWLQVLWSEARPSPEILPYEATGPSWHLNGSVRVLVVDDNPVNLMVISGLLESRGISPLAAADGAQAVELVRQLHFDLILMDLQMPILGGLEATSAIRRLEASYARAAVPVIAYSSSSPSAGDLATHGLNGSLAKPCRDQELEDCLVRWCPAYRAAPDMRGVADGPSGWYTASVISATHSAPQR